MKRYLSIFREGQLSATPDKDAHMTINNFLSMWNIVCCVDTDRNRVSFCTRDWNIPPTLIICNFTPHLSQKAAARDIQEAEIRCWAFHLCFVHPTGHLYCCCSLQYQETRPETYDHWCYPTCSWYDQLHLCCLNQDIHRHSQRVCYTSPSWTSLALSLSCSCASQYWTACHGLCHPVELIKNPRGLVRSIPQQLESVAAVLSLVIAVVLSLFWRLDQWHICKGNNDGKFGELLLQAKFLKGA